MVIVNAASAELSTNGTCQKCKGAEYSEGGSDTCYECSNANEIPNLLKTGCVSSSSCGSHTKSTNGYCECETGYTLDSSGVCQESCLPGYYKNGSGECEKCEEATYSAGGTYATCSTCSSGIPN